MAVLAKNALWYPILYFAAAKAGVVLVPVNWRLAPQEWLGVLSDAEPSVLVAGDQCIDGVEDIRGELRSIEHFVAEGAEPRRGWEALARWMSEGSATPPAVEVGAGDPLYQIYTSGTTGPPKGAVLSHGAVASNVMQVGLAHPVSPGERGMVVLPMFHAAIIPAVFAVLCRGGTVVVLDAFEPERSCAASTRRGSVWRRSSPRCSRRVCAVGGVTDGATSACTRSITAPHRSRRTTLRGALEAFGCDFVQSYGMTEAAQALTFLSPGRP